MGQFVERKFKGKHYLCPTLRCHERHGGVGDEDDVIVSHTVEDVTMEKTMVRISIKSIALTNPYERAYSYKTQTWMINPPSGSWRSGPGMVKRSQ